MSKYTIELALLGFDKGGNPVRFCDLPKEKENPDKPNSWHPCLFQDGVGFLGPIWVLNDHGKATLLEAEDLVRMSSYSWWLNGTIASVDRRSVSKDVTRVYMDRNGEVNMVPSVLYNNHEDPVLLTRIQWK